MAALAFFESQRVRDRDECRGTVRYVGSVATSKKEPDAVWVGVEWDDETRGKHDGSVVDEATGETHVYFRCARPTAGSFVKPAKLDAGRGLVELLREKYVQMEAPLIAPGVGGAMIDAFANTKRGATKPIAFCGELKVRAVQQLASGHVERAVLRCAGVRDLGAGACDASFLARLEAVDLQCNLLASWADVADLCAALPSLTSLDVSGNRLADIRTDGAARTEKLRPLARLLALSANGVGLRGWASVERLAAVAPALTTLHVASNQVCADLDLEAGARLAALAPCLELLDVARTGLVDASAFAALPRLRELFASENRELETLTGAVFPRLEALGVASCGLENLHALEALNTAAPRLTRLRLGNDNPLSTGVGASEVRAFTIARLATLRQLNGADVSPKERCEAEKRYVRWVRCDDARRHHAARAARGADEPKRDADCDEESLRRSHPRLAALEQTHADAIARANGADKGGVSGTLGSNLLDLTLRCVAASASDAPAAKKKLPSSTKVALLKRLARKLFDLEPEMELLLYYRLEDGDAPTYLDDDDATLAYFGLPDGVTVDVAEKLCDDT